MAQYVSTNQECLWFVSVSDDGDLIGGVNLHSK